MSGGTRGCPGCLEGWRCSEELGALRCLELSGERGLKVLGGVERYFKPLQTRTGWHGALWFNADRNPTFTCCSGDS